MTALLLAALASFGCGQADALRGAKQSSDSNQTGQLGPSENYKRERLRKALIGLTFVNERVQVDPSTSASIAQPGTRAESDAELANANALLEQNDSIGALARFAKAIIMDATSPKAYEGLARALHTKGETEKMKAALITGLDKDTSLIESRYLLAQIYQGDDDFAQQIAMLSGIAKGSPGYKETESRLAIAYYYRNDFAPAWKYVHVSEDLGKPVPPQFRELLESKMREPQRPPQN
ncbi:MAG: tetratricopeptide repeat protein [Fimbriimonadales bacterium]